MPHAHTLVQDEVNRLLDTFEDDLVFDVDQHSDDEQDVQVEIAEQLALLRKHRRLIAAAPKMLDALKVAGQVLDSMLNGQGLEADNMDTALLAVNNAITRATGRERGE